MPARTALRIRLDTRPVRWPEEGTQICDPRYDDAQRTPRQNIVVAVAVTAPSSAHLARSLRHDLEVCCDVRFLAEAVMKLADDCVEVVAPNSIPNPEYGENGGLIGKEPEGVGVQVDRHHHL
jgi:hypothetical protein